MPKTMPWAELPICNSWLKICVEKKGESQKRFALNARHIVRFIVKTNYSPNLNTTMSLA